MKTVQKYWVLSLFMVVGLVFAGCGDSTGTDDKKETTPAAGSGSDDGGDDKSDDKEGEGSADNASTNAGNGEFQLVSLNVPNMTWGGCASSVRAALAKVDGIETESIQTDTGKKVVSFNAKNDLDLDTALAAHKDNDHLKGWSKQ